MSILGSNITCNYELDDASKIDTQEKSHWTVIYSTKWKVEVFFHNGDDEGYHLK